MNSKCISNERRRFGDSYHCNRFFHRYSCRHWQSFVEFLHRVIEIWEEFFVRLISILSYR